MRPILVQKDCIVGRNPRVVDHLQAPKSILKIHAPNLTEAKLRTNNGKQRQTVKHKTQNDHLQAPKSILKIHVPNLTGEKLRTNNCNQRQIMKQKNTNCTFFSKNWTFIINTKRHIPSFEKALSLPYFQWSGMFFEQTNVIYHWQ